MQIARQESEEQLRRAAGGANAHALGFEIEHPGEVALAQADRVIAGPVHREQRAHVGVRSALREAGAGDGVVGRGEDGEAHRGRIDFDGGDVGDGTRGLQDHDGARARRVEMAREALGVRQQRASRAGGMQTQFLRARARRRGEREKDEKDANRGRHRVRS